MIKEIIKQEHEEIILHIQKTRIQSIQKKSIQKTGLRIYNQGCIGVAGMIGPYQESELDRKALDMLKMEIPYKPEPTKNQQYKQIFDQPISTGSDFVADMERLLGSLHTSFPDFSFSHNIRLTDCHESMNNDAGLSLEYRDYYLNLQFLFKHAKSVELIDGHLSCVGRAYDKGLFLESCREKLNAFLNPVELPQETILPVIFTTDFITLFIKFIQDLNGRNIATKSSKLYDKIGTKVFHEDFTLYQSHHSGNLFIPFYDSEGISHPETEFQVPLIQNGFIKQGFTDKRTALEYDIPLTGSAVCDFDGIPSLKYPRFELQPGRKTISALLDGRKGIYVDMASGGDYTPQGEFATPVQCAYLVEGDRLVGKLPPLQLNSKLEDMFGKDFIGVSKEPFFPLNQEHAIVINFAVKVI